MLIKTDELNKTRKITISAMVMALYVVIMLLTQSFAFVEYQVRVATALYAMSYLLPFLVIPLGLSNMLSNLAMGGMGLPDILGGLAVGLITAGLCWLVRRMKWRPWLCAVPIILIPGLGVALWLAPILGLPYWVMAANLLIGQIVPGVLGAVIAKTLEGRVIK